MDGSSAKMSLPDASATTPMMQQYLGIKASYPGCLLFYRMGDFYELFFDDAIIAAPILDIALTRRGRHDDSEIPMCGVPYHASDSYLQKLIKAGYRIAICEQLETPEQAKKRGYKAVVNREVVRIVTPGTITEDNLLEGKNSNYLTSLVKDENLYALAWADISTGEFFSCTTSKDSLSSDLSRINPSELLISEKLLTDPEISSLLKEWKSVLTTHVSSFFDINRCETRLKAFYEVAVLDSFGAMSACEIAACGSVIEYITITQKGHVPKLAVPNRVKGDHYMIIDAATRRNLEIATTLTGQKNGSLLSVIDKTVTNGGSRLLSHYIAFPLKEPTAINNRLDMVEFFVNNEELRDRIRTILAGIGDIERALGRLSLNRGGPRDLLVIRNALIELARSAQLLWQEKINMPDNLANIMNNLSGHDALCNQLSAALRDEVPLLAREGGFIREGFNNEIDQYKDLQLNSKNHISKLKERYRNETGIISLKIEQNNILGYYIEVTPQQAGKIQLDQFIHRQTLASAVRYTSDELRKLESEITNAKDIVFQKELEIFQELVAIVMANAENIAITAQAAAVIDVVSALAELARVNKYQRPIVDDSTLFTIKDGRHPVVEVTLKSQHSANFVPNNCDLGLNQRIWLLTGPNMAGKSTFLRQNALIAIMAHIGSFVPAGFAHIGIVDRIFSRVGASDDLASGRSTFMVEMVESATILNQATPKSLIILDELGRGTSTYDGLAIAWSCLEYIHDKFRCRTLFATHYHELTSLTKQLKMLRSYSMRVKEWEDKVIFLHEVVAGSADRSYGIYVAKLAGVPESVIKRAEQILKLLESTRDNAKLVQMHDQMPLLMHPSTLKADSLARIERLLNTVSVDECSPDEAKEILYKAKQLITTVSA